MLNVLSVLTAGLIVGATILGCMMMVVLIVSVVVITALHAMQLGSKLRKFWMKKPQKCYLTTSPEKSQQKRGNGSSNMGSRIRIGNRIPAILRPMKGSYLPSVNRSSSRLGVPSNRKKENGGSGVTDTSMPN
jgi:hypothetical protein